MTTKNGRKKVDLYTNTEEQMASLPTFTSL